MGALPFSFPSMGGLMRLRTISLAAAGLLTAVGSPAVLLPSASAAATGCRVNYKVTNQWPGGFQGDITITNLGDAVSSWSLGFDFPATSQKVTQGWGGKFSQAGAHVTVANETWNGSLGANANTSAGFIGSWSGSNPAP